MSLDELSSTTSCVVSDCCSMREHNCTYFCCISASCSCIERSCDLSTSFSTRFWWMWGVVTVSTRSSSSSVVAGSVTGVVVVAVLVAAAAAAAAAALLLSMKFCSVRPRFRPAAAAAAYRSAALLSCCWGWYSLRFLHPFTGGWDRIAGLARIDDTMFSTRARFMLSASGSARLVGTMPLPGVGVRSSRSLSSRQQSSRSISSCFAMSPPLLPAPVEDAGDGTVSSTSSSSGRDATSSSITSLFSCFGLIVSTATVPLPFDRRHASADPSSKSSHFALSLAAPFVTLSNPSLAGLTAPLAPFNTPLLLSWAVSPQSPLLPMLPATLLLMLAAAASIADSMLSVS
uniref:Uncharacterized protein n=1 Tax=Anopheles merus TaxID=30066 RepID=A0A182UMU3_ANOME